MKLSIASGEMTKPHAVVFDLDGTLVDSRLDIAAACNHALESLGRKPLDPDRIASFVGDGARLLVARALGADPMAADVDRAVTAFMAFYEANPARSTRLMPGAIEALEALGDRPAVLVTNKPRGPTIAVLDALGLTSRFLAIRAGGDGPLKPDPRAILDALRSIHVDPRRAWVVGDGAQDVEAGRAAGCVTVAVRGGFHTAARLEASRPDVLLGSLVELAALLRV